MENEEKMKNEEKMEMVVKDFSQIGKAKKSKSQIFTNITDNKKIFNLENSIDFKLNDCKGQLIRVKEVLIKIIEKPLEEPIINEETGEIEKDKEIKMITILIDDEGKSYVTASKMFSISFINYIETFGLEEITENGLEIEITERPCKNSNNKALSFKLV